MKLTMKVIEGLTCPAGSKDRLVFDDDQAGLAVRVTAAGSKVYLCQYTMNGTKRRVPLGNCRALSLAAAREAAAGIMGDRAKGKDVAAERKEAAAAAAVKAAHDAFTLRVLVETWERLHLAGKRQSYAIEAPRAIRAGFADCLALPAAAIDRPMVVRVLDTMTAQRGPTMAGRTVQYANACYQWAMRRGTLTANPFESLPLAPRVKRDRVLTDDELAAIWRAADPTTTHGAIVRTLILTGQRREEVGALAWDELSPDVTAWTLPGARSKNGAPHVVPLSAPVRALLEARPRVGALVFGGRSATGGFNGWALRKARLDAACGVTGWRLHDLRRTMATGLQRLGVRLEVTEAVLNHVAGSRAGIVGVYQRHDYAAEKRAALDAWAAHVLAVVEGRAVGGNVVALTPKGRVIAGAARE